MKKYLILVIPLLFLMAQCTKEVPPEPIPPTFQNTFSCYIDGKFWQAIKPPSGAIFTSDPGRVWVIYDPDPKTGYIFLQGRRDTLGTKESITLGTKFGETGTGRFKLRDENSGLLVSNCLWDMDSTKSWIQIEGIDTSKRILKGTFECKSATNFCGNGTITNGFFEVKY